MSGPVLGSGSFSLKGFTFFVLYDQKGRLWHLKFGQGPDPRFLKRLKRLRYPILPKSLPKDLKRFLKRASELYFSGATSNLEVPYYLLATDFERKVLEVVRQIPYGQVRTYAWVAEKMGHSQAVRAVGQALGRNPLPLVFPCHRVLSKQGLGGFSAGLEIKKKLLALEGLSFD